MEVTSESLQTDSGSAHRHTVNTKVNCNSDVSSSHMVDCLYLGHLIKN